MKVSRVTRIVALFSFILFPSPFLAQPMQNRLLLATSTDGLNFTRANVVVFDSADVPDAVTVPDGRVFLYFQGNLWPKRDIIVVGTSADGKAGWTFQPVRFLGIESWKVRPCDPDVVYRDGQFRLYFTGDPSGDHIPESYSAVSTDGISFTLEAGVRFDGSGVSVLDPSVLWTGDTLRYFAGGGTPSANWSGVSIDGLTFTRRPNFSIGGLMMSNGIAVPGGYRFYGFTNSPPPDIRSIFSADGIAWTAEPGVRIAVEPGNALEAMYVKDPAVVLRDGEYLMYYVSRKQEVSGIGEAASTERAFSIETVYPDPVTLAGSVIFNSSRIITLSVRVVDALGRTVLFVPANAYPPGRSEIYLDFSSTPSGVYFILLESTSVGRTESVRVVRR